MKWGSCLLVLMLIGCNASQKPTLSEDTYKYGPYVDRYVTDFLLKDGTRCVATTHGGVACNWEN